MVNYTFGDVLFKPLYSDIENRSGVDLTSDMKGFKLELPVISANMADITGHKMATAMAEHGGLGILHRFSSIEDSLEEYYKTTSLLGCSCPQKPNMVGVSIGVQEEDKERLKTFYKAGARIICIDIAHGHHILMKNMLAYIRSEYSFEDLYVIAGNVATPEGASDLLFWGANCVKVGIGPGSKCSTRKNTGAGYPQLSALESIRNILGESCPIISDGGINSSGDIAKALKFANAVMVASFLAGTTETPGKVYQDEHDNYYKCFGGSASAENKVKHGKNNEFVEGVMSTVRFRGRVKYILKKAKQNLQSSFSYSGSKNFKEFQKKSEFIFLTGSGKSESKI